MLTFERNAAEVEPDHCAAVFTKTKHRKPKIGKRFSQDTPAREVKDISFHACSQRLIFVQRQSLYIKGSPTPNRPVNVGTESMVDTHSSVECPCTESLFCNEASIRSIVSNS